MICKGIYKGWIPAIKNIEGFRVDLVEHNVLGRKFNECEDPATKEDFYYAIKVVHDSLKEKIKFITKVIDSIEPTTDDF